jgi:hypothetical protein
MLNILIIDGLLDYVIRLKFLEENHREKVRNALLLKHVHQFEKGFQNTLDNGEKRSFPLIKSLADMGKKVSQIDMTQGSFFYIYIFFLILFLLI